MAELPASHIDDAHKLLADGEIYLYELVPLVGGGTIRFTNDNSITWRGNEYTGLPVSFSGDDISAESGHSAPKLTVGQPNLDISEFKPLIFDGALDGGTLTRIKVLLEDILANNLIRQTTVYEVRQVLIYTRTQISLQLALPSDGVTYTIPHRTYGPPDHPTVRLQ